MLVTIKINPNTEITLTCETKEQVETLVTVCKLNKLTTATGK